jgi:hypothetical protein
MAAHEAVKLHLIHELIEPQRIDPGKKAARTPT